MMLEVTIKSLDGRNSEFQLDEEITVEDFKKKIESELNIPVAQQRLIFQGRVLRDDSKLNEYGVQNKVIHLVPRPPPSAQREQPSASADDSASSTTSTGFVGFPWGGLDMQQVIQDITSGIFTGLGELGRNAHLQVPAEADLTSTFPSHASLLAARENTFNRLHSQATHLLRRIIRHPLSPAVNESEDIGSPATDESAPASPTGFSPGSSHCATASGEETKKVSSQDIKTTDNVHPMTHSGTTLNSPMNIDPDPEDRVEVSAESATSDTAGEESNGQAQGADNSRSTDYPLSTLASMLSRHRRLWRSAEPYFERWESMINNESRIQQTRLSQRNAAVDPTKSSSSDPDVMVDTTPEVEPNEGTNTITLGTDSLPLHGAVSEDACESLSDHHWQHRFFLQVSRLLHLHAHMLHLISDFNVISITEPSPRTQDLDAVQSSVSSQNEGTTIHNTSSETKVTTTASTVEPDGSALPRPEHQARPYPRRILNVPETDTQHIHTSINVEPIGVVNSRPVSSNISAQESRSRFNLMTSADRRRSQSASVVFRNQNGSSDGGERQSAVTNTATTTTTTTSNSRTRPTGFPITSASIRGGPAGTGGTAIVHRLDIPIISMNMINLPLSNFFERLVPPTTTNAQTTTTVTTATSSVPSAPVDSVVSTTSSFSVPIVAETQMTVTATPGIPVTAPRSTTTQHIQPIRVTSGDPFLSCNSRHFTQEHGRAGGAFTLPLPFSTVHLTPTQIPPGVTTDSRTADGHNGSNPTQVEQPVTSSVAGSVGSETTTTTTPATVAAGARSDSTTIRFPSGFTLPQRIASFVSVATNAAASAANASGLHMGHSPFNVLVSSSPMQFTIDTSRSNANSQSADSGVAAPTSGTNTGSSTTTPGNRTTANTDPMQPLSWLFGRNNPLLSSMSMSTPRVVMSGVTDTSRPSNVRPRESQSSVTPIPAWADARNESSAVDLTNAQRILIVFTEAIVETVWAYLAQTAAAQGVDVNASSGDLRRSQVVEKPPQNQRISVGFLRDILSAVQSELPRSAAGTTGQNRERVFPETLDGVRTRLSHLLVHADAAVRKLSENSLIDGLINVMFDRRVTDGDVTPSSDSLERRALGWMCQRVEDDRQVIDVRASLARMFRTSLSSLLDLWRNSPINFGFGSVLLTTLSDFCVYTICMIEVLSTQLIADTGLLTQSDDRPASMPLHILLDRLRQFADTLGNENDARLCRAIVDGVEHCITTYSNHSAESLRTMRDHSLNTFVVRRSLAPQPSVDVEMKPQPSRLEQCVLDDADLDDLPFEDASSDLPATSIIQPQFSASSEKLSLPPVGTDSRTPSGQSNTTNRIFSGRPKPSGRGANSGNISPLPNGTPKPGEVPEPLSRALDPHPDSARSLLDASNSLQNPEGWHAVLPAEWLHVVAGDVATMGRTNSTLEPNTPLDQFCRFSDAYIAGMPAKRRKVMEEHSKSIAQPPDAMLAECLSDAIRVSGCRSTTPETDSSPAATIGRATVTEQGTPDGKVDLVLSLRDLVSERIAARLSTDPDFDPTQFPLSQEAFVKKRLENN